MKSIKTVIMSFLLTAFLFTSVSFASPWTTAAKMRIQSKEYKKALELLMKEIKHDPESIEGYYLLGFVYGKLNRIDDMVAAYDKCIKLDEDKEYLEDIKADKLNNWAKYYNLGVNYFNKGNKTLTTDSVEVFYNKSAASFQTAIKIEPDSLNSYTNLAFVLLNAQKYDEAISPLQTIIDKGKSRDGYRFLGTIYYNKAKDLKYKFETSKNPDDSVAYMKMYDKAIEVLEAGKKMYPNDYKYIIRAFK